ncbi:hypothetical protein [Roseateles puraquae]|jgi:hypothetical protein|uniref:Uncharacterized protein n=1 Tax=Roseateles puraquae TaxID=431059 RepID=A0A254NA84_9BURK|nr:hypothetical protein [Roseateles puraquae]MDG0856531.1 hypothetical protein [Roseateles puraquae]OWR02043.1 hypothetical protein CDO81_22225 [Roseateles puraquae]
MNALARYLLLRNWSNTAGDFGSSVFRAGKVIGILGRVLGLLFLPLAIVGSMASTTVLFFVGYGTTLVAIAAVLVELFARLLMLAGNALSQARQRRGP